MKKIARTVLSATALLSVACGDAEARTVRLDLSAAKAASARMATVSSAAATASASVASGVVRQHRLTAGAAKVSGLAVGDEITFTLFDDKELTVTLAKQTPALSGRSFLGRIDNALGALGCVVLETDKGLILDVTDFEHDRVWQVVSDASGVTVREVKPNRDATCGNDAASPGRGPSPVQVSVTTHDGVTTVVTNGVTQEVSLAVSKVTKASLNATPVRETATTRQSISSAVSGKATVDILVNYDTDAAKWAKANGGGVTNFAETCVQKMNSALANTELTEYFSFRLVGVYEVGGSAGGNLNYALDFADGTYAGSTLNGVSWDGVREERDRVFADIVCTLCDNGKDYGTVGLGNSLISGYDAASCGFNACEIRAVAQSHTMTHEVGHNIGAGHSDAMADADNRGPQYYDYSSGYYFYVGSTGYYTIMAYNADGYGNYYASVPYFSSPDYTYLGVKVGTSVNDNTKTLRLNYQMVADNRKEPFVSDEIGQGFEAEAYTWTTDGTYPWTRVTDRSSDGADSVCSSLIPTSGGTTSWTETVVIGPATLSFRHWFVSYGGQFLVTCDGSLLYSYGSSSSAIQARSWTTVSGLKIPSGVHTVRFSHINNNGTYYVPANAVWVDRLQFEGGSPYVDVGDDQIPELTNPTTAQIETVLKKATDVKLATHITSGTEYNAFRTWSGKVQPHGGGSAVGAAGVMAAPHAWLSYALDSATLLNAALADDDLTIEKFEPKSEKGRFDFTVGVEGVSVGSEASKENLKQVFGLKGGTTPDPSGFSSDNVDITFGTPSDGKVKFTAGPKDTSAKTFFMKVKVAE